MAEDVIQPTTESVPNAAEISVSLETYLTQYADDRYEWVDGRVVKMAPATNRHYLITRYLSNLLETYLTLRPIGTLFGEPLSLNLVAETRSFRIPDLMVVLTESAAEITDTGVKGPADIVIEVVSPESEHRDYGKKLIEYRTAGVPEYWIINPLTEQCDFHRLGDAGRYHNHQFGDNGQYTTPLLPDLVIDVAVFWQESMPDVIRVVDVVKGMLDV